MNTNYTEEKFVGEMKEENCFEYHSISEINISHCSEKSLLDYKWKCLMAFYFIEVRLKLLDWFAFKTMSDNMRFIPA